MSALARLLASYIVSRPLAARNRCIRGCPSAADFSGAAHLAPLSPLAGCTEFSMRGPNGEGSPAPK